MLTTLTIVLNLMSIDAASFTKVFYISILLLRCDALYRYPNDRLEKGN